MQTPRVERVAHLGLGPFSDVSRSPCRPDAACHTLPGTRVRRARSMHTCAKSMVSRCWRPPQRLAIWRSCFGLEPVFPTFRSGVGDCFGLCLDALACEWILRGEWEACPDVALHCRSPDVRTSKSRRLVFRPRTMTCLSTRSEVRVGG